MALPHPHETASVLVARAKAGDDHAFGELVRRYRDRILALALHMTGDESEADDIAQEVFLRAYAKLSDFQGRSEFFTWVYRMTVNRCLNLTRDRKRRCETALDDPRIARAVAVDAAGDPVKATALRQTYARLLVELDRLPPAMRTSVILVALQGLSHAEAGVVQKCSAGTVAWRIHEARVRLKAALEPSASGAPVRRRRSSISGEMVRLLREFGLPLASSSSH